MSFTRIEQEVVRLWVACASLDSMVNQSLLKLFGDDGAKEVQFKTATHRRLFNILLLDFLEEKVDGDVTGLRCSCLELLDEACRTALFDQEGSVEFLTRPLKALRTWLETEISVDPHLPEMQFDIKIRRSESLCICGNISKHNRARLTRTAVRLVRILSRNGFCIDSLKALHLLDDFYERFHKDIFTYHSTVITELLNNVRWGMHDYLHLEYVDAKRQDRTDPLRYSYRFPRDLVDAFARSCYWDLMNSVRRGPYLERFIANSRFKQRY